MDPNSSFKFFSLMIGSSWYSKMKYLPNCNIGCYYIPRNNLQMGYVFIGIGKNN